MDKIKRIFQVQANDRLITTMHPRDKQKLGSVIRFQYFDSQSLHSFQIVRLKMAAFA